MPRVTFYPSRRNPRSYRNRNVSPAFGAAARSRIGRTYTSAGRTAPRVVQMRTPSQTRLRLPATNTTRASAARSLRYRNYRK